MHAPLHSAVLSIGSNVDPLINLKQAVRLLQSAGSIDAVSAVWETAAVGSPGPNFFNAAVLFHCACDRLTLKDRVLRPIEASLGRVRQADKNAPRPVDLDIIIFDGEVLDQQLWEQFYIARPCAELLPGLVNPFDGATLRQTADRLHGSNCAIPHPEVSLLE